MANDAQIIVAKAEETEQNTNKGGGGREGEPGTCLYGYYLKDRLIKAYILILGPAFVAAVGRSP